MEWFAHHKVLDDLKQLLLTVALVCGVLVAFRNGAVAKDAAKSPDGEIKILLKSNCGDCFFNYTVLIFGDGRVVYESLPRYALDKTTQLVSRAGPLIVGRQEDHVSPEKVTKLVKKFESAKFGQLKDTYQGDGDDFPSSELTITSSHLTKSVFEYAGMLDSANMPHVVFDLEKEVGELAGIQKWLHGDATLVPWLEAKKFDFSSDEASQLIATAATQDIPEPIILALLGKGISLDRLVVLEQTYSEKEVTIPAGQIVLESAISHGRSKVMMKLSAEGWLDKVGNHSWARIEK